MVYCHHAAATSDCFLKLSQSARLQKFNYLIASGAHHFRLKSSGFRDEASCEMRGGEFKVFLRPAGKNLCAAGKRFFHCILRADKIFV